MGLLTLQKFKSYHQTGSTKTFAVTIINHLSSFVQFHLQMSNLTNLTNFIYLTNSTNSKFNKFFCISQKKKQVCNDKAKQMMTEF